MSTAVVRSNTFAHAVLLCALGGALLSLPVASKAASKTLTISGTPATTVAINGHYSFTPGARDTVKSRIKFDIYNKPSWASFDGTTGRLYGTPHRNNVGTYNNITIRLTDWYGFVTTAPFSITVLDKTAKPLTLNPAPSISGAAAATAIVGTTYRFTPKATDSNGERLTFSIANQPKWAKFDATTGTLSGIPAASDVGKYANIQISVSDGNSLITLAAFAIAVNQVASTSTGSATLDWTPPTENTDGTALSDLAGYTVRYGRNPSELTQVIKVANAGLTSLVVDELSSGTWYFTIASYNREGAESSSSAVVSAPIL
jgi:hypothetical protein